MWVRSLGLEDPLGKEMATHSSILARRTLWTKEAGGYSPWGCTELDTTERLNKSLILNLRNGHYPQAGHCDSTLITLLVFPK